MRDRLVHALGEGRDSFPEDAARAQADYDCWVLNGTVPSQAAASAQCRASLGMTLAQLERDIHPPVAVAPPPAAPPSGYTAYFDFDSWTLSAEDLAVLQQAIADARSGGQAHIAVVGHTDTSGSARYNMRLSKKRANVVKDALADMGARRAAISTTGVGKTDLAVPTGDGVREPKNRRAVVTLQP
jgi:OOP family OmpA-OmpF porin